MSDSVIERIDKALELYYDSFLNLHVPYKNSNDIGKFQAYCSADYDSEEDAIKDEMEGDEKNCTLVRFDEDDNEPPINHFPLNLPIEDEDERDHAIYLIIKHCYRHGEPPMSPMKENDLYPFVEDNFQHILESIPSSKRIHPRGRHMGSSTLMLNQKKSNKKSNILSPKTGASVYPQNDGIKIKLNDALKKLIEISRHKNNDLFNRDLIILLIDAYYRYCVITEIMETQNIENRFYAQVYYRNNELKNKKTVNKMGTFSKFKFVSNMKTEALEFHQQILNERSFNAAVLLINGEYQPTYDDEKHTSLDLRKVAEGDYRNTVFKFMSSNRFYWELIRHKSLKLFNSAFDYYTRTICGPLRLKNMNKINDNIFIYWMYIWCMSNVVKTYMLSGDITIPLQIDLVILPNTNEHDAYIDDISERFNIHNQKFESVLCDPTNIDSIKQKLETVFIKISVKMKKKHRIVIIVDRRSRPEYFKDKHFDRIYGYKPPDKYALIDKKYEIINAVWNTSNFIIPHPPKVTSLIGAKSHNLFVLTFFIRKKAQFTKVFDYKVFDDEKEDMNEYTNILLAHTKLGAIQSDDGKSISPTASLTTVDTNETLWAELNFIPQTPIGKKIKTQMHHRLVTSTQLTLFMDQVQNEIKNEIKSRKMTITCNIQEYKKLEDYIIQVALNRKRDTVANMYLYYNRGYMRFEPMDLIQVLPQFFDIHKISNYDKMMNDFKKYHDKLWEIDDDIWMKYKQIYLRSSTAMHQKVVVENLGTDPKDREIIRKYCIWKKDDRNNQKELQKYEKVIHLECDLRSFIDWRSRNDGKGIIINKIKKDYADDLKINDGETWSVIAINGRQIHECRKHEIDKILNRINVNKGYQITLFGGLFSICDGTEHNVDERVLRLCIKLNKFLKWNIKKNIGIKIQEIDHNDYGIAFKQSGVVQGWFIKEVEGTNVSRMSRDAFESFLNRIPVENGYNIRFTYPTKTLAPSAVRRGSDNR